MRGAIRGRGIHLAASDRWPATPGYRLGLLGHPAGIVQGSAEENLDLGVEAAELVGGPPGERVMNRGIKAQRDLLALAAHV
jgi:hypothetical protein